MAASSGDTRSLAEIISTVFIIFLGIVFFVAYLWWSSNTTPDGHRSPSFSVMVTHAGSIDPLYSPVIHPAFDLYLRVDNPWDISRCRENATVTVSYGGVILGWGKVQDFCVDKRASMEVKAVLSHADVMLTDELRRSMASEMRAGELEVSVELKMLFPKGYQCQRCARETLQYCRVRPGQGYSPYCQGLALELS